MNGEINILGFFVSYPSLMYDATKQQKENSQKQGDLFQTYIWGDRGIGEIIKKLSYENYGKDMKRILFQFYVNPIPYELQNLKEIEAYRKNEKAIGIPIIVTDENFFSKTEEGRYDFLKQSILQKLDLLAEVVKKKKLDTKMDFLKADLQQLLS